MTLQALVFRGQPAVRLAGLPGGDSCTVALHGAHVLSWTTADGVERLYLSPEARFDGQSPIRGGVPSCWPQFNQRGPLAQAWLRPQPAVDPEPQADERRDTVVLALRDGAATRALWPHAFRARLAVTLAARSLRVALSIDNLGGEPWSFAAALHSYLRVDEATAVRLEGLQGANRWDAVRDERHVGMAPALVFGSEFDSVYAAPARPLRLVQPSGTLEISQSASCTETVVWTPVRCSPPSSTTCPTTAGATCSASRPPASTNPCCWRPAPSGRAGNS